MTTIIVIRILFAVAVIALILGGAWLYWESRHAQVKKWRPGEE